LDSRYAAPIPNMPPKRDTRTRVLVTSLLLFNKQGEPNTTTNAIADELDISPGNLHYHFRRKSEIIDALLAEFQADVRRVLEPPSTDNVSIVDFWVFLHLLLEVMAGYHFLLRDMETLSGKYPKVGRTLGGFAKGLTAVLQLYLDGLDRNGVLNIDDSEISVASRNLAVIALFSERFSTISGVDHPADAVALETARSILALLLPYSTGETASVFSELSRQYRQ
jgi:AcrR family transcriptional regulator